MVAWLVACSWAEDGELWLRMEETSSAGDHVLVVLPVSSLREPGDPVTLETPRGPVDLRRVAKGLRVGAARSWTTADGGRIELVHTAPAPASVSVVAMGITGPKGGGLEVTFPLEPAALGQVHAKLEGALDVDVNGLDLELDDEACAQLRRSPPTTLLEVVGPKGNGLRVNSR